MKKLFILAFAFLFWSTQTVLATDVSGTISTDAVWDISGSPYLVTSSITIDPGATLSIEAGVSVMFSNGQYLYVSGALTANGVLFTSANASPSAGDWGYIQVGDYYNYGNINLVSCQIQYASQLYVYHGEATLTNTDLTNFYNHGVVVGNLGNLHMIGGNISTNSAWAADNGSGIYATSNSHSTMSGVHTQHFQFGITLNSDATMNTSNIYIVNCNWPVIYYGSALLTVSGISSFIGNTHAAINMPIGNFSDTLILPKVDVPYYFPYGMTVNSGGRLEIASNSILKFQDGYVLDVYGSLLAEADAGESIYFTSYRDDNWGGDSNNDGSITAPSSGNWWGVIFRNESDDANCLMRRCQVRFAGYNNTGGISTYDASPTIDECEISNCYHGIYLANASNAIISNNTIGSSQMTPFAMSFEANPTMANNSFSFSDNAYDAIGLIGGSLTADASIIQRSVTSVPNISYILLDQITVPTGISLNIAKGIVIKSYYPLHRFIVNGTLNANATADSMITFTSAKDDNYGNPGDCNKDGTITSPTIGDWGGIIFNPGSLGTMNYCRIKYASITNYIFSNCSAGEYLNEAGVGLIDANPTITNCEFKDLRYGVSCYRASNPVLSNNSMVNITYTPFCISGAANPVFSGNTFTNVGWRAIGLLGGHVCQNGSITKRDMAGFSNITYVLLSDMVINSGTYVNVEAGVVIKVNNCNMYVDGGFKTDGSSAENVVFTSLQDDNEGNPFDSNGDGNATTPTGGNWGAIKYRASSDDSYCSIDYTMIKYGGNTNEGGLTFENAGGHVSNSSISNTSNFGLFSNGNSTPVINHLLIQNCSLDPIAMSLTSNPSFSNITLTSNFSQAIKIIEGTLSSDATLTSRNLAGITNIAYVIDKLIISSNAKLTIEPGVVVKFRSDSWPWGGSSYIVVHGNLIAKGTALNKIYFTSFADDSKGGDSNNNGNTTSPEKGDWGQSLYYCDQNGCWKNGGLLFINNSANSDTVNSLKNCEISYAGTGLFIENTHVTIDSCVFQLNNYYGASIIGSANPHFSNCEFYNITNSPVELSLFSSPTFSNCLALNVGLMAFSVIPETYSQSATVPSRDFGGFSNISYFMEGTCTINSGTTINIPAGLTFKKSSPGAGFIVNGRLNVAGTALSPVTFTDVRDDNFGSPLDMNQDGTSTIPPNGSYYEGWEGNWITFNDVSNDSSSVNNAIIKYGNKGIVTLSASPGISNSRFENLYYGIDMNGVSAPKIDYCTFHNLKSFPIQISLVSYPATSSNNIISGSTYKVIKVRDEILTQDVTLPKRNFGGVTNIPYYFENYTVGTSAKLTINPGIVCKFQSYIWPYTYPGKLDIFKGLTALGGSTPDSNIVFTSILDDFYGGDSNADSTATAANSNDWQGLVFENESLDPLCKLRNCIVRFADKGIQTISASPNIEKCNINNNNYGVFAAAASNPVISNCDFNDNLYYGVCNYNLSFVISAENCWWGSNAGPIQQNIPGDGSGTQEIVTFSVDYTPWKTTGTISPLMGDVSLNGLVQAYDASLVLQKAVGNITLNSTQLIVADVSAAAGVTAYDASLILQYVVGLIQYFPAELTKSIVSVETYPLLTVGSAYTLNGQSVSIPLSITNVNGMSSAEIRLQYDPNYLQLSNVNNMISEMNMLFSNDSLNGILTIVMAGTYLLEQDAILVNLAFNTLSPENNTVTPITVTSFLANENDMTSSALSGSISIAGNSNSVAIITKNTHEGMSSISPNPSTDNATLFYCLTRNDQSVNIAIYNSLGQKVTTLVNGHLPKGEYSVSLSRQGNQLDFGAYFIQLTIDGIPQTQLLQIVR